MKFVALALLASLTVACSARVADDHAVESHLEDCGNQDAAECAITHFEKHIGPLAAQCQETVRASTIELVTQKALDQSCPEGMMGCTTDYTAEGATAWVLNDNDRLNTTVHELTHIALRCARGDFDASHSRYFAVWSDLMAAE